MDDLDRMARELEAEMREEAIRRLKAIKPNDPTLAEEFRANGTIYVQDTSAYVKVSDCFRKANKPEMNVVHFMEDEQGNLPYFIIRVIAEYETIYYFLYVSYDKRNWRTDHYSFEMYGQNIVETSIFEVHAGFREESDESPINTLFSKFTSLTFHLGRGGPPQQPAQ